ncbi:MAG: NAD(P)H-dependent oxidoreductase [Actinomycetota bacterium]|nr:NAD(P)H-dependent oxidoreductase [Actinomycetota bacterium]
MGRQQLADAMVSGTKENGGGLGSEDATVRVLAICGSLRRASFNRKLLGAAHGLLPPGAELVLWDDLKSIPPFDEDDEHAPTAAVVSLRSAIEGADAVLIASPEYNGSLPGQLKNALDWASRPYDANVLRHKPVAVIGASPGPGGAGRCLVDARKVLSVIGARVVDHDLRVPRAHMQFDTTGQLADPELRRGLEEVLAELCAAAAIPAAPLAA